MTKSYVGLSTSFHDPAIAVVNEDGEIEFAEALERSTQVKRAFGIGANDPNYLAQVLKTYCDDADELILATTWRQGWRMAALALNAIRQVAQTVLPESSPFHRRLDMIRYGTTQQLKALNQPGEAFRYVARYWEDPLTGNHRRIRFHRFDHHLCHAAATCFAAPYKNAACAIIDGYGEWSSTAFYTYRDGALKKVKGGRNATTSLGWFYALATIAGGFNWLRGEEWKLMGLAGHAELSVPNSPKLDGLLSVSGLKVKTANSFFTNPVWKNSDLVRDANFAAEVQKTYTDILITLLANFQVKTGDENLCLGGGCALNTSANSEICPRTPFKSLYVNSAPADDGTALGAALLAWSRDNRQTPRKHNIGNPYLGSRIPTKALKKWEIHAGSNRVKRCKNPATEAAGLLAQGKIIGWMRGRAEFGPRALGNRSILADPRRSDIVDILNTRVKFRESFRPFAPAILDEYGPEWFHNYQTTRYMERILPFREECKSTVPGVVHADGTGRLQSVRRDWNPSFYELISAFHELSGVPLVLNTSLNVMGKPIVHSLQDALAVFYTSGLDALFVEDRVIKKDAG